MFIKVSQWEAVNTDHISSVRLEYGEEPRLDYIIIKNPRGREVEIGRNRIFPDRTLENVFNDLIGDKNAGS